MYFSSTSHFSFSASGILLLVPLPTLYLTKNLCCPTQAGLRIEHTCLWCSPTCEQNGSGKASSSSELPRLQSPRGKCGTKAREVGGGGVTHDEHFALVSCWGGTMSELTPCPSPRKALFLLGEWIRNLPKSHKQINSFSFGSFVYSLFHSLQRNSSLDALPLL